MLWCAMHHGQGNKVSGCFPLKYKVVVALLLSLEKPNSFNDFFYYTIMVRLQSPYTYNTVSNVIR